MKRSVYSTAFILLTLSIYGCAQPQQNLTLSPSYADAANNPFIPTNYRAADVLMAQLQDQLPTGTGPLIVTTLVNIDSLNKSSTFGRVVSEQLSSRFTQAGYEMIEMKFGQSLYIRQDQGEMMLTREIHDIAGSYNAKAVIVGTYGESRNYVFVNLKVVKPNTNSILAVYDYTIPINDSISSMLRSKRL